MNQSPEFVLQLSFPNMEEVQTYINVYNEFTAWKEARRQKKDGDMRGKHIKELHRRAKTLHELMPNRTYRECMRIVSSPTEETVASPNDEIPVAIPC
jgi:hypothetical protein